ncbi:MAG: RagB/SusD family nutrient uptake outer membrane protein [Bacteroidales bacterium]|nr:RagB/SusD family nutrient uptake outer membrane protein [Bacteroidales bacterium]
MKHKITTWALAAFSAAGLTSCSESFLDREPDGSYITKPQLGEAMKWNSQVMLGEVQGISTNLVKWSATSMSGTTRQDCFGQKAVDIATDLMTGDMVFSGLNTYGWFLEDCCLYNASYAADRTYMLWCYYYSVIHACNLITDMAGGTDSEPTDATQKYYFAVAKTIRAHSYFNLITLFAHNYDEAKDKKTLPVYDTQEEVGGAPQTVDSVYNFILRDLEGAVTAYTNAQAAGFTSSDISMPDLSVAYTVQAYVQLQKGEYANALAAARNAISASQKEMLSADDLFFGFNTISNNNWMWGIDITESNTDKYATFWSMMDYFTYGYQSLGDYKVINADLFDAIPATDNRRQWFAAYGDTDYTFLIPANKFFDAARTPGGDSNWVNDIHFMRIEEPYMIAAEAAARLGDLSASCGYLSAMLASRDAEAATAIYALTQDELLEEIYFNWRLEFWGEGKSLLTLKRFKKSMTRPENDYYKGLTALGAVPYSNSRFTFAIPQRELQNNQLMNEAEQ